LTNPFSRPPSLIRTFQMHLDVTPSPPSHRCLFLLERHFWEFFFFFSPTSWGPPCFVPPPVLFSLQKFFFFCHGPLTAPIYSTSAPASPASPLPALVAISLLLFSQGLLFFFNSVPPVPPPNYFSFRDPLIPRPPLTQSFFPVLTAPFCFPSPAFPHPRFVMRLCSPPTLSSHPFHWPFLLNSFSNLFLRSGY